MFTKLVERRFTKSFGVDVKMAQEASFIHTGIRHTKIVDKAINTFHDVLDQNGYAEAIKPVSLPELLKLKRHGDVDRLVAELRHDSTRGNRLASASAHRHSSVRFVSAAS